MLITGIHISPGKIVSNTYVIMLSDIKISVIIPAYNSATFIEETLFSIQSQDLQDFEIIIIDDGSTDNTKEVIRKYQADDTRIKYYYKPNGGVSSARNLGIEKAKGEFISFLDSDDSYDTSFLKKMYTGITSGTYNIAWCGFQYKIAEKIQKRVPVRFGIKDILLFIINENWISTDSWMIRKSFLKNTGIRFTEGCHYGEDFEFFCKLVVVAGTQAIKDIPEYLTNYNLRGGSLSQRNPIWVSTEYINGSLKAYKSFYDFLCQQSSEREHISSMAKKIKKCYLYWLWGTLLLGKKTDFKNLYRQYQEDKQTYQLNVHLTEAKYSVWQMIVTTPVLRELGRYVFIPYKYIQRKIKISKLRKK